MNAAVRLKRYIQQLTFAKGQCEKNLSKFGWNGNYSNDLVSYLKGVKKFEILIIICIQNRILRCQKY